MSDDLAKQMIMELTSRLDRIERLMERFSTQPNLPTAFMPDSIYVGDNPEGRPVFHFHGKKGPVRVTVDKENLLVDFQQVKVYGVHDGS